MMQSQDKKESSLAVHLQRCKSATGQGGGKQLGKLMEVDKIVKRALVVRGLLSWPTFRVQTTDALLSQ